MDRLTSTSRWKTVLPITLRRIGPQSSDSKHLQWGLISLIVICLVVVIVYKYGSFFVFSGRINTEEQEDNFNYGIVLDAGSSGTRAYLYYWPQHTGNKDDLLSIRPLIQDGEPMVKKVMPGLSSQEDKPDNAFEYLRPLLMFASENIPAAKHKETPLYILATAGMRLIEKQKQEAILDNVRDGISKNFKFYFPESHLEIITGKQEGIYQWLAINYVLGKFNHNSGVGEELVAVNQDEMVLRPQTVGALDMGGASVQIAMEITTDLQLQGMSEKDKNQVVDINLGCAEHDIQHRYRVFVNTFLGFGANQALRRHHITLFLSNFLQNNDQGMTYRQRIKDPCQPTGLQSNITLQLDLNNLNIAQELKQKLAESQTVYFYGTGDWDLCYKFLENFTTSSQPYFTCSQNCPDSRINIPPIQFDNSEFYGFSEFWYSMDDVLRMGGHYMYHKFRAASKAFCSTRWMTSLARFKQGAYPNSDLERLETQCFKSAWVSVALHQGFLLPQHYAHLTAAPNTVHGEVVHWTLGALLYRTRYLPLRSLGKFSLAHKHHSYWSSTHGYGGYSPYLFWLCCTLAVVVSILLYMFRLRRYVRPCMVRMSMFNNEEEQQHALIRRNEDFLFANTKVFSG